MSLFINKRTAFSVTPWGLVPNGERCKTRAVHTKTREVHATARPERRTRPVQPGFATDEQRAREIVDRVDRLLRGDSSRGTVTMQIVTENWQRSLTMQILSQGTQNALVRIQQPKKEAGTATLKVDNNIWNYLPKVSRHNQNSQLNDDGRLDGPAISPMTIWSKTASSCVTIFWKSPLRAIGMAPRCMNFCSTPRPEAPVVWGKIELEVRQDDLMPTWQRYYDEDGTLMRELRFSDYTTLGGRLVPARMVMQPQDKPQEQTVMEYDDMEFDIPIAADTFSLPQPGTLAVIIRLVQLPGATCGATRDAPSSASRRSPWAMPCCCCSPACCTA